MHGIAGRQLQGAAPQQQNVRSAASSPAATQAAAALLAPPEDITAKLEDCAKALTARVQEALLPGSAAVVFTVLQPTMRDISAPFADPGLLALIVRPDRTGVDGRLLWGEAAASFCMEVASLWKEAFPTSANTSDDDKDAAPGPNAPVKLGEQALPDLANISNDCLRAALGPDAHVADSLRLARQLLQPLDDERPGQPAGRTGVLAALYTLLVEPLKTSLDGVNSSITFIPDEVSSKSLYPNCC